MENYYSKELDKLHANSVLVKFDSDNGATKWMNINEDSIEAIIAFLQSIKDGKK